MRAGCFRAACTGIWAQSRSRALAHALGRRRERRLHLGLPMAAHGPRRRRAERSPAAAESALGPLALPLPDPPEKTGEGADRRELRPAAQPQRCTDVQALIWRYR